MCFAESPPEFLFVTGGAGSDGFPLFLEVHHFRPVFAPVGACGQGFSPFDEGEFLALEGIADLFLRVVEQLLFAKEDIGQLAELCPQRLVVLLASEAGFLPFFLQIQNGRGGLLPGRMRGLNLFRHHFAKLLDQGCFRFRIGFEAFADLVIVRFGFLKNRADDSKECVRQFLVRLAWRRPHVHPLLLQGTGVLLPVVQRLDGRERFRAFDEVLLFLEVHLQVVVLEFLVNVDVVEELVL